MIPKNVLGVILSIKNMLELSHLLVIPQPPVHLPLVEVYCPAQRNRLGAGLALCRCKGGRTACFPGRSILKKSIQGLEPEA